MEVPPPSAYLTHMRLELSTFLLPTNIFPVPMLCFFHNFAASVIQFHACLRLAFCNFLIGRNGPRPLGSSSSKQIHETAMIETKITEKKQKETGFYTTTASLGCFHLI